MTWTEFNDGHGPSLKIRDLRNGNGWSSVEVMLGAGSKYTPGREATMVTITIHQGKGILEIGGISHMYCAGSKFVIDAGVQHCFSLVKNVTIYTKKKEVTKAQAAVYSRIKRLIEKAAARLV